MNWVKAPTWWCAAHFSTTTDAWVENSTPHYVFAVAHIAGRYEIREWDFRKPGERATNADGIVVPWGSKPCITICDTLEEAKAYVETYKKVTA